MKQFEKKDMVMYAFSARSLSLLNAAGWRENYEPVIEPYLECLQEEGYPVFSAAVNFLQHFGGLRLSRRNPIVPRIISTLALGIDQNVRNYGRLRLEIFSEDLNAYLCPVGIDTNDIVFVITPSGSVYGVYDIIMLHLGDSGEQALENWCNFHPSNPFRVIHTLEA